MLNAHRLLALLAVAVLPLMGCAVEGVGPEASSTVAELRLNGAASAARFSDEVYDAVNQTGDAGLTIIDEDGLHRGGVPNGRGAGFIVALQDADGNPVVYQASVTTFPDGTEVITYRPLTSRFFIEDQNDTEFDLLEFPMRDGVARIEGFNSNRSATIQAAALKTIEIAKVQGEITEAEAQVAITAIELGQDVVEVLGDLGLTLVNPAAGVID